MKQQKSTKRAWYSFCFLFFLMIWDDPIGEDTPVSLLSYGDCITHLNFFCLLSIFRASRSELVCDNYGLIWDCTRHAVPSHRRVEGSIASEVDIFFVGTCDELG